MFGLFKEKCTADEWMQKNKKTAEYEAARAAVRAAHDKADTAQQAIDVKACKSEYAKLIVNSKKKLCPFIDGQKLCVVDGCIAWENKTKDVKGKKTGVYNYGIPEREEIKVTFGGYCSIKGDT